MTNLAMMHLFGDIASGFGLWMFLSIGAVALFVVFIPLTSWIDSQRKEREAFYKAETMRRLAESSGEGAKAAIELLQEQDRRTQVKKREGMKIGGLINMAVGVALMIFLRALVQRCAGLSLRADSGTDRRGAADVCACSGAKGGVGRSIESWVGLGHPMISCSNNYSPGPDGPGGIDGG